MNLLNVFRRPTPAAPPPIPEATLAVINAYHAEAASTLERLKKQGALQQAFAYNDPYRYQTPQDPRFRPYSALSTDMLRMLGHSCDIPARCIAHLKSEVTKVPVKIVAKDSTDEGGAVDKDIEKMRQFFSQRGGLGGYGTDRATFESRLIEDLLVIGAASVWFQGDTLGALKTGNYTSIEHVGSATIRPIVTAYVRTPGPGDAAFEQWIMGTIVGTFYHDEMIYKGLPSGARSDSPYFYSCTEQAAFQIFTIQKIDEWNREFLINGNGHRRWVDTSAMTPESATDWLAIMKAQTTGNAAQRQGIGLAPGPLTGEESRKDQDFEKFEDGRIERICAAYGVNPASIGFTTQMLKQSQEGAMGSTAEGMVTELLMWRESLYNDILERMGYDHLVVTEDISEPTEEPAARTSRQAQQISGGIKTANEVRAENGDEKIDGGDKLLVASTLAPIEKAGEDPPVPPGFGGGGKNGPPGAKDEGVERGFWESFKHPRGQAGRFSQSEITDARRAIYDVLGRDVQPMANHGELEMARDFVSAFAPLLARMTPLALTRFSQNVNRMQFYGTPESLRALLPGYDTPEEPGGCYDGEVLHVDFGRGTIEMKSEAAAHEMAHAIDGPDETYSRSDEWHAAWDKELANGQMTTYATKNAGEGFAEFGRAVLTGDEAEVSRYRQCAGFWKKRGLA